MIIKFNRPTIYTSHPIRGISKNIEKNCKKAASAVRRLRKVFPEVDFYCPAEHDLTLQILTSDGRLTVDDVMYADIMILKACHGWMYYSFEHSKGSEIEQNYAIDLGLSDALDSNGNYVRTIFSYDIEKASNSVIRKDFGPLVEFTIHNFKTRSRKCEVK